ncbi:MAG: hypothetical protein LC676_15640 [Loktanella sp.]|nr:hypothetical protein [Loktanella sp.]
MLEYHVSARRIDSHGSEATTKEARITLDIDMAGRTDAFNPAEMLLASLASFPRFTTEGATVISF